jgi:transcriptional regulator GlxA family with amidase domain
MAPSSDGDEPVASGLKDDTREDQAMSAPPISGRHRVAVIALPGVFPFELGIPARVFGAAQDADGHALYEVVTCSVDGRAVATNADFVVVVSHDLGVLASAETVVIPPADVIERATAAAPAGAEEDDARRALDTVGAALRDLLDRRTPIRVASICTAADILAHAGLLDGRPATTHWRHAPEFADRHPAVRLNPHVLYVDDGDVLTAAGAASGIDLCLHIVRRDHGVDVANRVARACVVPPHRDGGQAQYVDHPVPSSPESSTAATRAWALARLDTQLALADLAAHAAMSVRTFTRRFRAEVGLSPTRWLIDQRVTLARRLLETTDLPVDQVAQQAGLGTAASLRLHMAANVGISPTAYRRTFHAASEPPATPERQRHAESP